MVDAQDAHVGTTPGTALLDLLGGVVVDTEEGNGARSHTRRATHPRAGRTQLREVEASPTTRLVDQGGVLECLEDPLHPVWGRQNEASVEHLVAVTPTSVDHGRCVAEELTVGEVAVESTGHELVVGHRRGDTPEPLLDRLDTAVVELDDVAVASDDGRLLAESHWGKPQLFTVGWSRCHAGTFLLSLSHLNCKC